MGTGRFVRRATAVAVISLLAGCASWDSMNHHEKTGTAVGAAGGAAVGAAVGGPVGAVVAAGVGGLTGNQLAADQPQGRSASSAPLSDQSRDSSMASERSQRGVSSPSYTEASSANLRSTTIRDAQQALNDQGFDAGNADGIWGPRTEKAVRAFQAKKGLTETTQLDHATLAALGVNNNGSQTASTTNPQAASNASGSTADNGSTPNTASTSNTASEPDTAGASSSGSGPDTASTTSGQPPDDVSASSNAASANDTTSTSSSASEPSGESSSSMAPGSAADNGSSSGQASPSTSPQNAGSADNNQSMTGSAKTTESGNMGDNPPAGTNPDK